MEKLYEEVTSPVGIIEFSPTEKGDKISKEFRKLVGKFIKEVVSEDVNYIELEVLLKDELEMAIVTSRIKDGISKSKGE